MKKTLTNKAFTLIELLIVISIISLLSTVIMYSTSEAKLKADDAHMKVESGSVATAVRLYKEDNGGRAPYPVDAIYISYKGQMVNENDANETKREIYQESMQILVDEGYLPELPTSPDGFSYSYMVTEDETDAVFAASLNNPSSGSNKNKCNSVGSGINVSSCITGYEYCDFIDYNESSQLLFCEMYINDDEGNLLDACDYSNIAQNQCNGEVLLDYLPSNVCDGFGFDSGGTYFCLGSPAPKYILCEYTGDFSVCSGSSDSDYCSCI